MMITDITGNRSEEFVGNDDNNPIAVGQFLNKYKVSVYMLTATYVDISHRKKAKDSLFCTLRT